MLLSTWRALSKCSVATLFIGISVVIVGIISAVLRLPQNLVDEQFKHHLVLSPNSPVFEMWMNPPGYVYMKYYIFNVTNINDVIDGGKPIVKEFGPYTYAMDLKRFDVAFYSNDSVSFRFNRTLYFMPELSSGSEDDVIYHLNMPLVTIGGMMETLPLPPEDLRIFNKILECIGEMDLFVPHTASEILFGYVDPFFELISRLASKLGIKYDPMFAPFYKFNQSDDGVYLVDTGAANFPQANEILRWQGEEYLKVWGSKYANMFNGTDGSFFRPYLKKEETRYVYFSDMCRSLELEFENYTSVGGVDTLRYHLADDIFANYTERPDNIDFCTPPGHCYDKGMLNIAQCRQGAPAVVSLPHFYNCAPQYQNAVSGLSPSKEKHDFYFDVEPRTGIIFDGTRKLQINMEVKKSKYIRQMKNVRELIFPVLWLGGGAALDHDIQKQLKGVMTLTKFMNVVAYLVLVVGVLVFIGALLCNRKNIKRAYKYESINGINSAIFPPDM